MSDLHWPSQNQELRHGKTQEANVKCPVSEEQLALYTSSDLNPEEGAGVSEHLVKCAPCRQTLADLQLSLQLFAEISVAPNSEDLRSLRNDVMQRLRKNRSQSRSVRAAAIAASLGLLIAPLLLRDKAHDQRANTVAHLQSLAPPPIPSFNPPDLVPVRPVYYRVRKHNSVAGLRAVAFNTRPEGRPELRISTADPNVVILLEMDGNIHEN
jgi:hypothetical protein